MVVFIVDAQAQGFDVNKFVKNAQKAIEDAAKASKEAINAPKQTEQTDRTRRAQ